MVSTQQPQSVHFLGEPQGLAASWSSCDSLDYPRSSGISAIGVSMLQTLSGHCRYSPEQTQSLPHETHGSGQDGHRDLGRSTYLACQVVFMLWRKMKLRKRRKSVRRMLFYKGEEGHLITDLRESSTFWGKKDSKCKGIRTGKVLLGWRKTRSQCGWSRGLKVK